MAIQKIFIVYENWYDEDGWNTVDCGTFEKQEDAELTAQDLRTLNAIKGKNRSYEVAKRVLRTEPSKVFPAKLRFYSPLEQFNNTFERITFVDYVEGHPEIKFRPLPDNVHSCYSKGDMLGWIEFIPTESHEQHIERAMKLIQDNFHLVPDWVLKSKDGHDPAHPQKD